MRHSTVIQIHPLAAPKPAEGEPCNGCGVCCAAEPCPVGVLASRSRTGSCAALTWVESETRYRCGMAFEPERFVPAWLAPVVGRAALRFIAAGQGCDCSFEAEPG